MAKIFLIGPLAAPMTGKRMPARALLLLLAGVFLCAGIMLAPQNAWAIPGIEDEDGEYRVDGSRPPPPAADIDINRVMSECPETVAEAINDNATAQAQRINNLITALMYDENVLPQDIADMTCLNFKLNLMKIVAIIAGQLSLIAAAIVALIDRILNFVCEIVNRISTFLENLVCIPLPDFGGVFEAISKGNEALDGILEDLPGGGYCDGVPLVDVNAESSWGLTQGMRDQLREATEERISRFPETSQQFLRDQIDRMRPLNRAGQQMVDPNNPANQQQYVPPAPTKGGP